MSATGETPGGLTVDDRLEVDRLELQVREVKFLAGATDDEADDEADDENNDKGSNLKDKGLFLVDVLSPDNSVLPAFELDAGTYKKVEFKISKPGNGEGIDGTDAPVVCEGALDGVAFRLELDALGKITLRDVDGVKLEAGQEEIFLVDLNTAAWFDGIDATTLEVGDDGVALIDAKGANKEAHDAIQGNITAAIKLLRKP